MLVDPTFIPHKFNINNSKYLISFCDILFNTTAESHN